MIDGAAGTVQGGQKIQDPHHHNGRISLLKVRGDGQFKTSIGRSLFRVNYIHLMMKFIILHQHPPRETGNLIKLLGADDEPGRLAKYHIQAANLCADAQFFFDCETRDEIWVLGLLQITKKAMILDLMYQEWFESLSGSWLPRILRKSSNSPPSIHSVQTTRPTQQQYLYHDNLVAFNVNTYRSCRIHLLEVLLHCHTLIASHEYGQDLATEFEDIRATSRATVSELILDICSSVSFCLGDIDCNGNPSSTSYRRPVCGYLLFWPLWISLVSSEEGSQTETFCRDHLKYIGKCMGIRLAHKMATRPKQDPWNLR